MKKVKLILNKFHYKNIQLRDVFFDLINFKLLKSINLNKRKIYFKVKFTEKFSDNLNKIFKDNYNFFKLNCFISVTYNYDKPFSSKLFIYR